MEKKLTDEEIVKAYFKDCNEEFCHCCPLGEEDCSQAVLDLIHRLQGENKEIKKDYIELDLECRELRTELYKELDRRQNDYAKLQKQVDELTAEKEDLYFQNKNLQSYIDNHEPIWKRNAEKAVKETAKDILTKAEEFHLDCSSASGLMFQIEQFVEQEYGVKVGENEISI